MLTHSERGHTFQLLRWITGARTIPYGGTNPSDVAAELAIVSPTYTA